MQHIYIVDSDPAAALVTQQGLQKLLRNDAQVLVSQSRDLIRLNDAHAPIDLVIVDPEPRNREVRQLIERLCRDHARVPVLVLTAYDNPGLRTQMQALGVRYYLAKPVDLRELEQIVRQAVQN